MVQEKKCRSAKGLKILYISVMALCTAVLIVLIVISALKIHENQVLKEKQAEIIEKYQEIAKENENLKDENYAQVYFDGMNMYIPQKEIIIEYQP